jgi:dynein intermediate chain 2
MAYDICYKINEPAFSYKVCNSNLNCIALNAKGNRLLVGDEEGKVHLIKLSESFYSQYDIENKKEFISKFLERENARERALDVKKKPVKDDHNKMNKQEQLIKEKINKIEQEYYPYLTKVFGAAFNSEYFKYIYFT